jgi:hypothetical protein
MSAKFLAGKKVMAAGRDVVAQPHRRQLGRNFGAYRNQPTAGQIVISKSQLPGGVRRNLVAQPDFGPNRSFHPGMKLLNRINNLSRGRANLSCRQDNRLRGQP